MYNVYIYLNTSFIYTSIRVIDRTIIWDESIKSSIIFILCLFFSEYEVANDHDIIYTHVKSYGNNNTSTHMQITDNNNYDRVCFTVTHVQLNTAIVVIVVVVLVVAAAAAATA